MHYALLLRPYLHLCGVIVSPMTALFETLREVGEIMTQNPITEKPTMFPYLVYRDATTAFNWLADVFGFKKTAEVLGPNGQILHAEMSFGAGIMKRY